MIPEIAMEEMKILGRLGKMATMPNEEEEILQTRIVSPREVSEHWDEWLPAIQCEVESLLRDKEAFREDFPDELQRLMCEAEKGREGNRIYPFETCVYKKTWSGRREQENEVGSVWKPGTKEGWRRNIPLELTLRHFASCMVWWAARFSVDIASTLDVRTAFLNAKMVSSEDESLILVRTPSLLTAKAYLRKDVDYLPEKAIYGLRRSPRLWRLRWDDIISGFEIKSEFNGKMMEFFLEPLQLEAAESQRPWRSVPLRSRHDLCGWHPAGFFSQPTSGYAGQDPIHMDDFKFRTGHSGASGQCDFLELKFLSSGVIKLNVQFGWSHNRARPKI